MITLKKLEKIVKIWMNTIKTDREEWYKTSGFYKEHGWLQKYELSPPCEVRTVTDDARFVYIESFTDDNNKPNKFVIYMDKPDNHVLSIYPDGEVLWTRYDIDTDKLSENFMGGHISKLRSMILEADKTIEEYLKENPEFDMDSEHRIIISKITFNDRGNINIDFYGDDRILNNKNKLYIGFKTVDEEDKETFFVFKVKEKEINCMFSYKFGDLVNFDMFHQAVYHAEFLGHWEPTEEEILHATFRWVVSDEVIKTANKESRYT